MPMQKKSRQGSNSTAAKLISRANSSKTLNHSLCNNSEYPSNGHAASSNHDVNNHTIENYGDGLTAKQQQQLERNAFLDTQTKDQLKQECRRRGQKTTGNKTELLQRLGYKMSLEQKIKQSQSLSNLRQTNSSQNMKQSHSSPNGTVASGKNKTQRDREKLKAERETLTIIRRPVMTLTYFLYECLFLIRELVYNLLNHKKLIALFLSLVSITTVFYHIPGPHQALFDIVRANLFFIVYWTGLGVLSSVGLGTGLHTFLLYLGPHIASVTIAAYECNSLNFPSPPYPDEIICPETTDARFIPSLWNIMSKVRPEAFLWGAGTALGELPPYFMAKAARLSGYDPDDAEDLKEFEELQKKKQTGEKLNMFDRAKLFMEKIVERVGFFGILACASIPNPLFDLAGITCGHFLVPFWTFFGATLIGKAVIKMHIQKIFVIVAFDETLLAKAVDLMALVPFIGKKLQEPFKSFLKNQKIKLHRGQLNKSQMESGNLLQRLFEKFVIAMIVYFVLSIINSFAQSYHKRIHKKLTGQPAGKGGNHPNQQHKLARD